MEALLRSFEEGESSLRGILPPESPDLVPPAPQPSEEQTSEQSEEDDENLFEDPEPESLETAYQMQSKIETLVNEIVQNYGYGGLYED